MIFGALSIVDNLWLSGHSLAPPRIDGRRYRRIYVYVLQRSCGGLLFFCITFGKIMVTSLNSYGSFMCMVTLVSGFRRGAPFALEPRRLHRPPAGLAHLGVHDESASVTSPDLDEVQPLAIRH